MRKNKVLPGSVIRIATVSALVAPAAALAGGFSLNEQSASAMGVANAGTAANPEKNAPKPRRKLEEMEEGTVDHGMF